MTQCVGTFKISSTTSRPAMRKLWYRLGGKFRAKKWGKRIWFQTVSSRLFKSNTEFYMYKMDLNTVTSAAEALWVLLANWSEILWDSFRASVGWRPGDTRAHIVRVKDVRWCPLEFPDVWNLRFHVTDLVICGADMVRHTLETHAQAEPTKIIPPKVDEIHSPLEKTHQFHWIWGSYPPHRSGQAEPLRSWPHIKG